MTEGDSWMDDPTAVYTFTKMQEDWRNMKAQRDALADALREVRDRLAAAQIDTPTDIAKIIDDNLDDFYA